MKSKYPRACRHTSITNLTCQLWHLTNQLDLTICVIHLPNLTEIIIVYLYLLRWRRCWFTICTAARHQGGDPEDLACLSKSCQVVHLYYTVTDLTTQNSVNKQRPGLLTRQQSSHCSRVNIKWLGSKTQEQHDVVRGLPTWKWQYKECAAAHKRPLSAGQDLYYIIIINMLQFDWQSEKISTAWHGQILERRHFVLFFSLSLSSSVLYFFRGSSNASSVVLPIHRDITMLRNRIKRD